MDPAVLPVIGTIAGTAIGALTGVLTVHVQSRTTRRVADMQARTQLQIAAAQHDMQVSVEISKRQRERKEEAYRTLMLWLDDIQVALEQVHSAVFSDNQEALRDALTIVDEWPWQTLRAPQYTAETRYLWSNAVDTGLREAFGISASWTPYARPAVLAQMTHETRMAALGAERADRWAQSHPPESEDIRGEMWDQ
jgi:gas vesicle protein